MIERYFCSNKNFTVSTGIIAHKVASNIKVVKDTLWKLEAIEKRGIYTIIFLSNHRSEIEIGILLEDCKRLFVEIVDSIDDTTKVIAS